MSLAAVPQMGQDVGPPESPAESFAERRIGRRQCPELLLLTVGYEVGEVGWRTTRRRYAESDQSNGGRAEVLRAAAL